MLSSKCISVPIAINSKNCTFLYCPNWFNLSPGFLGPIIVMMVVMSNNHQMMWSLFCQDLFTCDEHRRTIVKLCFHKIFVITNEQLLVYIYALSEMNKVCLKSHKNITFIVYLLYRKSDTSTGPKQSKYKWCNISLRKEVIM